MKKGLFVFGVLSMFISLFAYSIRPTFATESVKDQANDAEIGDAYLALMTSDTTRAQTFSPSKDRLTQIDIYLKDRVSGSWVEIALIDETTSSIIATSGTRMGAGDGWEEIGIGSDLEIDTNKVYRIKVYNESNLGVKWTYNAGSPYAGGMLWYGPSAFDDNSDLNFRTWGYNEESEQGDSELESESSDQSPQTSSSESLGEVSSSIAKPTNLQAKYDEQENKRGVKLTWNKSSTDNIEGYKIFRSLEKNKNFTKIFEVGKNTLMYLDQDILPSKTYYYIVRAYLGASQSYSSNTAEATTPEDIGPSKPQSLRILDFGRDYIEVAWTKNDEDNLSGYRVAISKDGTEVDSNNMKIDETSYRFESLEADTTYTVSLVAKNSEGKVSPAANIVQTTKAKESSPFLITTLSILCGVCVIALLILLVFLIKKRRAKEKAKK